MNLVPLMDISSDCIISGFMKFIPDTEVKR